ncbi:hypothetical protein ACFRJ9_02735 [Paenarthrobacter sp. NPDC056912]|uniref:hypothetical protein n=1 Tax=Paenarthrobacter sp. NPDC056912 TaxID=3345965 RepID=UPI00367217E8
MLIAQPASANGGVSDSKEELREWLHHLDEWYSEYDVPAQQEQALLKKIRKGEAVESDKPGSSPVTVESRSTPTQNVTVKRFSDGSITVSKVERPRSASSTTDITPMFVGQCQGYSGGSGYAVNYDCLVQEANSTVDLAFRATYTHTSGYDQINDAWGAYYLSYYGNITNPELTIPRRNEVWNGGAYAQLKVRYNSANGAGSQGWVLRLWVQNNTAFTNLVKEG